MNASVPEIYVIWHPKCELGGQLVPRIYAWLRPGNGLGPRVFYRSAPAPEAPKGGLPPQLPGESQRRALADVSPTANTQICLLLIDELMIADAGWRAWIAQLGSTKQALARRIVLPVALDSTAYNVPAPLRELNFLRPVGLPLPTPSTPEAFEVAARSLLRQLTEALCRILIGDSNAEAAPTPAAKAVGLDGVQPKITIFLSHAKADGTIPTRKIRDYIYSQTQLAAFYDENDILFGSAFGKAIQTSLQARQTVAMIAIRSAAYASRPWCRREISLFRRPHRHDSEGRAEHWRLNPLLVVDAMEAATETTGTPELGNAPIMQWVDDDYRQEEKVVTTLLREVMLAAFHDALGRSLGPSDKDTIVINWSPHPISLLCIPRVRQAQEKLKILYPGRGLSGLELDTLEEIFPRLTFHSFEDFSA